MDLIKLGINLAYTDSSEASLDKVREQVYRLCCEGLDAMVVFTSDASLRHVKCPDLDFETASDKAIKKWNDTAREELMK